MSIAKPDISNSAFLVKGMHLHEMMQEDIRLYKCKGLDKEKTIQGCFEIATNYRFQLLNAAAGYQFENRTDEILFFKKIKPLFNGEAEFQTYLYHAEIFRRTVEDDDELELQLFYRRQLQRRDKFAREHPEIFEYLVAERTDRDEEWFTRLPDDAGSSIYDKQVGTMIAIKRYEKYVLENLIATDHLNGKKEDAL